MRILDIYAGSAQEQQSLSVHKTFSITWEAVKSKDPHAIELLQLWAFLSPESIWFGLLEPALLTEGKSPESRMPHWFQDMIGDELRFYRTVKILLGYSVISLGSQKLMYSIHRLMDSWVRYQQKEEVFMDNIVLATVVIGSAVSHAADTLSWSEQRQLLPHAIIYSRTFSSWDLNSKVSLVKVLDYHDTEKHRRDLEKSIGDIGRFLLDHAYIEEAAILLHPLLVETEGWAKQHAPSNPDSVLEVGRLMLLQGRFRDSEELLESLLGAESKRTPNDQFLVKIKSYLAAAYLYQDKMNMSKKLTLETLDALPLMESDRIKSDLVTALSTIFGFNLIVYYDTPLLMKCHTTLDRLLRSHSFGQASDTTINVIFGCIAYVQYIDSRENRYLEDAAQSLENTLGDPSHAGLEVRNNLACVLAEKGRLHQANSILKSTLDQALAMFGSTHPSTIPIMRNLALIKYRSGEVDEAKALTEAARNIVAKTKQAPAIQNMIVLPWAQDTPGIED